MEKQNVFQAKKEWLLPSSNTKYIKKKYTEEKTLELNTFSLLEDECLIEQQEIHDNEQPYKGQTGLSNWRKPQIAINQYPEDDLLLQKDKEKVVPENSSYKTIDGYDNKSFIVGKSVIKGLQVKNMIKI